VGGIYTPLSDGNVVSEWGWTYQYSMELILADADLNNEHQDDG
jgi:hypothetical protein